MNPVNVFVLTIVSCFSGAVLSGWTVSLLWGWFVAPQFGLPPVGVAQGLGIALLASFLTKDYRSLATPSEEADAVGSILKPVAVPLMALALGWLVKTVAL